MSDVCCANCGEPWEVYHLRHDEVYETEAGGEMAAGHYRGPRWEGKLTEFWRAQFAELGWRFGSGVYVVLRCPCCKGKEALPDAAGRAAIRQELGELLGDDEDGLACELEDLDAAGY